MKLIGFISILVVSFGGLVSAQQSNDHRVLVEFYAIGLPSTEMTIVLRDSVAYIPMKTTFDYLGIKNDFRVTDMQLQGFFKTPDTVYNIEFQRGRASIQNIQLPVTNADYILLRDTLYLRTGFLNDLFGLDFKYAPRRVRVELKRSRGLPAVLSIARHRRFEMLAKRQLNMPSPDYILGREPTFLGAGRFDWLTSTSLTPSRFLGTRFTLSLGLQVLAGDFTGNEVGFIDHGRNTNDFRGQYRLPFLDNNTVQQLIVGDYVSNGIQVRLMRGAEITNRPLAQRFNFSREVFHGQFDPHIDVDMAGTAFLPQFQQTNDLGIYQFDVPIIYGQGLVQINAYDQWGRVQALRYRMNVSRDLLPPGQFEYSITGGKTRPPVEMYSSSDYVKWGVSSDLTMGMKFEYFDLINAHQKFFPALTATSRLWNNIVFSGSISPQSQSQASLSWLFLTGGDFEATATQYAKNSFFNPAGISHDINATASLPMTLGRIPAGIGASFEHTAFDGFFTDEFQGSVNATFQNFSPRLSTVVTWRGDDGGSAVAIRRLYDASLAIFLPAGVLFQPEVTYEQISNQVESIVATLAKSFGTNFRLFGTYGRFPQFGSYSIGLNLSYYFPFARAQVGGTSVNGGSLQYSTSEAGSIGFDTRNGSVYFANLPTFVGFGGLVVRPFYDANNNGVLDNGEELIDKAHVFYSNVDRGTPFISMPINRLSLDRLSWYENFDIYLEPQSLENPIWVPRNPSFRILSEPNYIRRIDMPVVTGGTIRGTVYIVQDNGKRPAEEIKISITALAAGAKSEKIFSKSSSTFSTGEFEFSPLPPGRYRIDLNPSQLHLLGFTTQPMSKEVELTAKPDGDIISNVDFELVPH